MPTLKETRRRLVALEPLLGRIDAIASLTTTTVVVNALATGTATSSVYGGKWLVRADAASSADRVRLVTETGYASSTGTLTHAGANYSDTTATSELLELLEYDPALLDGAITDALQKLRRIDTQHFQSRPDGRYPLTGAFPWLTEPSIVVRFGRTGHPVLTPNRHFEQWGTVHTDGTLRPDGFTLAGSGATFARSTSPRRGQFALAVTRSGTDATVSVTIPVRYSDAAGDDLRGKVLTAALVALSAQANSVRVRITSEDASGTVLATTNSSYHSGGGGWEEIGAQHTVDDDAEQVTISARVEVNETARLDELYLALANELTDDLRRDAPTVEWLQRPYRYEQNPLVWLGFPALGEQIVMESQRPYPAFDETRLRAGTADADTTDCPLDLLAYKALALFFAGRATTSKVMAAKAAEYAEKADQLQQQHLYVPQENPPGNPVMSGRAYGTRRSIR